MSEPAEMRFLGLANLKREGSRLIPGTNDSDVNCLTTGMTDRQRQVWKDRVAYNRSRQDEFVAIMVGFPDYLGPWPEGSIGYSLRQGYLKQQLEDNILLSSEEMRDLDRSYYMSATARDNLKRQESAAPLSPGPIFRHIHAQGSEHEDPALLRALTWRP